VGAKSSTTKDAGCARETRVATSSAEQVKSHSAILDLFIFFITEFMCFYPGLLFGYYIKNLRLGNG
jgi:hypothetical protein